MRSEQNVCVLNARKAMTLHLFSLLRKQVLPLLKTYVTVSID